MQLVHTAAEPPNHGRISFAMSGCTWNSRNALSRMVAPNRAAGTRGLAVSGDSGDSLTDDEGMYVISSFVSLDGFQIAEVTHYRILVRYAIGPQQVAADARA